MIVYLFCALLTITAEKQRNTPNDSDADDEEEPSYCPCGAENSDDMIWCDGDDVCTHKWFHYKCVGLTSRTIPPGKWFCPGK